jgi:SulP family sulfate permease
VAAFDFQEVLKNVTIDVSQAHFWDLSAVAALDRVVLKFRREGTEVNTVGMNQASQTLVLKLGTHHKNDADINQALH